MHTTMIYRKTFKDLLWAYWISLQMLFFFLSYLHNLTSNAIFLLSTTNRACSLLILILWVGLLQVSCLILLRLELFELCMWLIMKIHLRDSTSFNLFSYLTIVICWWSVSFSNIFTDFRTRVHVSHQFYHHWVYSRLILMLLCGDLHFILPFHLFYKTQASWKDVIPNLPVKPRFDWKSLGLFTLGQEVEVLNSVSVLRLSNWFNWIATYRNICS